MFITSTTNKNTKVIGNYIILATTVMFTAMGLTDTFLAPTRAAQENRLDNMDGLSVLHWLRTLKK